jgi:T4 superinfection immunity protein
MSDFGGGLFICFLVFLYFLPTVVCVVRKPKAANGIEIVNLFLGWTFIGWVIALAWAASGEVRVPEEVQLSASNYDPGLWKVTGIKK